MKSLYECIKDIKISQERNFLMGIYENKINLNFSDFYFRVKFEDIFITICGNGHIEIAKWLWEISKSMIDMHFGDEFAFRRSCENGYLDMAQWLWNISNETINIHVLNEYAFKWSCYFGEFQIAKWLWEI